MSKRRRKIVIKSRYIDLRCERRLTLSEGRLLLALLDGSNGRAAKSARRKLAQATAIADHTCKFTRFANLGPDGQPVYLDSRRCSICGRSEDWTPKDPPKELKFESPQHEPNPVIGRIGGGA